MKNKLFSKGLKFGLIATLLATTGCAEYHKRVLEDTREGGCEFTRKLAREYEALGKAEQHTMYDECSADYYYCKAIRSREGNYVSPSALEKWDIPEDKCPELVKARGHLMSLLLSGAQNVAPEKMARAQSHFDCWVEQQAEGWQKNDIAYCRSEFYKAIAEVDLKLKGGIQQVTPKSMVLFENNMFQLTQESLDVIKAVAHQEMTRKSGRRILLVGRTDKIGDLKHNKELSKQRAMAVKEAFVHNGFPAHMIVIKAPGETAGPNVDAHNRRVDIIFLDIREHKK